MESSKPVLLTVDDDPGVSRAVARDLRKRYGRDYRIVRAESGRQALEALREIKLRGDLVAVLLADYRMPEMSGLEFLEQAMDLFPHARRALLTAYADTDAAIQAINVIDLDHYLLKPWEPPSEKLYPVLDELVELWRTAGDKPVTATQVVGHRWSARSYEVRDFLARNSVSYRWLNADEPEGRRLLEAAGLDEASIPLVVTPDGDSLVDPGVEELAARVGLSTTPATDFYDTVIVGGGPAGLGAAVYAASEGLRTVLVEQEATGGQAGQSAGSRTTLASPTGSAGPSSPTGPGARRPGSGPRSSPRPPSPAWRCAARRGWSASPTAARSPPTPWCWPPGWPTTPWRRPASTSSPAAASSTGRPRPRPRPAPARTSTWSGGPTRPARRRCSCRGTPARSPCWCGPTAWSGRCRTTSSARSATPPTSGCAPAPGSSAAGTEHLERLRLCDTGDGTVEEVEAGFLFVFIGAAPHTEWLNGVVDRDRKGFVVTGPDLLAGGQPPRGWPLDRDPYYLEASVPGVFAAGDARANSVKRVASAVGEGAMAIQLVHRYLEAQ